MSNEYQAPTDKKNTFQVESVIANAQWQCDAAVANHEASVYVKTALVGDGATIEIKGRSSKGKAPGTIKGQIFNNCFYGKLPIPDKVEAGAEIWFEAKLPKHGISQESNSIPARQSINIISMKWDKSVIHRDELVTMTVEFESGVENGTDGILIVYEYSPEGHHEKVLINPVSVENMKIEVQWEFKYPGNVNDIPTEKELATVKKHYTNPKYFFVVVVNGITVESDLKNRFLEFRDSVTITVKHGVSQQNESQKYNITFADNSTRSLPADKNNRIIIDNAPPGPFTILPENRFESDTVNGKTGTPLLAIFPDTSLLIDAHMHIQSNNCCPLPLQWAILAENAGFIKGRPSDDNRKDLNDTAAGLLGSIFAGRLGKIGRLSSDMISQLYREELQSNDMKLEMCWTILSDKEMAKYANDKETMRIIAGKEAELSSLSMRSSSLFEEKFIENTRYYFEANRIRRMSIAQLMDMSFSNYWARYGIPLYLSTNKGMFYINDFASVSVNQWAESNTSFVSLKNSVITPEISLSDQLGKCLPSSDGHSHIHLFPSFTEKETAGFGSASFYTEQYALFNNPDASPAAKAIPLIRFKKSDTVRNLLSRKYIHFIDQAPGEDSSHFEDYALQRELSIAGTIMYPLSLFAFYHYDPRRHCISTDKTAYSIASQILDEHAFFTYKENKDHQIIINDITYSGCIDASMDLELNDKLFLSLMLNEHLRSNDDALNELHLNDPEGPGMFWGVKMYPRLGFSPSDFVNYPQLDTFYKACAEKNIPVTAHCGPGGMSIADYYLYERYDEQRTLDIISKDNHYNLRHAAERFDGVINGTMSKDSPARWAEVLQKHPALKLNLAHFGNSDTWKEAAGFSKAENKLAERGNTNSSEYNSSDRYRDWIKRIAELVEKYENVYTDISYFVNDDPSWIFGLGHDHDDVAEDLIYLLKNYPSLKDRLLMGSDWYMIERDREKGIGDYFRKMFYMLRSVSKETGYDAWHQFSVVNPLRFLGLIDGKKGNTGPFTVTTRNLEPLYGKFEKKINDMSWKKMTGCNIKPEYVQKSFSAMLSLLKSFKILSGDNILTNSTLTILQSDRNDIPKEDSCSEQS